MSLKVCIALFLSALDTANIPHQQLSSYTRTCHNPDTRTAKMSSTNAGRESPAPEFLTSRQQRDPISFGKTAPENRGDPLHSKKESDEAKFSKLESNPHHVLEDIEAKKFEKTH